MTSASTGLQLIEVQLREFFQFIRQSLRVRNRKRLEHESVDAQLCIWIIG